MRVNDGDDCDRRSLQTELVTGGFGDGSDDDCGDGDDGGDGDGGDGGGGGDGDDAVVVANTR